MTGEHLPVSPFLHLVPLAIAALGWVALARVNRAKGWLRVGEVMFWDAVLLAVVFLVWLRWFRVDGKGPGGRRLHGRGRAGAERIGP